MAVKFWTGHSDLYEFDYDGGSHSPVANEQIMVNGAESAEYATIQCWTLASGTWGGSTAAGKMWVYASSADFITNLANNDVIEDSGGTKICDTTGGVTAKATGDWQTTYRWGTGEDPAVPLADDEVIFDSRSDLAPTEGMLDSESGATAQSTFDLLHFKKGYTKGVGASGEPLACSPNKIIIEGTGTYYILNAKDNQTTLTTIIDVFINNPDAIVYLYSNSTSTGQKCEYTNVYITAGTLYIAYYTADSTDTGCFVRNLYMSPRNGKATNVTVTMAKDCYFLLGPEKTNVYMNDGTLTTDSGLDLVILRRGTLNFGTDLGTSPETELDIETLRIHGGTFNWYPDDSDNDAYIADLLIFGGSFVASGTTNADRTKVLGNGANNDVYLFEGGTLNIANGRGNISIAGSSQFWNFGGTVTVDNYSQLAVTYDQP